jgi:hypothetical protein
MRHWVVAMSLVSGACATHNRLTAGPTFGGDSTKGADITGELSGGDGGLMMIAGATGRIGHDLGGAAFRLGLGGEKAPTPFGFRAGVTLGPTIYENTQSETHAKFEARGAFAAVWGFKREPDPHDGGFRRTTLGLELYASTIGLDDNDVLIGIGLTVGSYHGYERSPLMASRKKRKLLARD